MTWSICGRWMVLAASLLLLAAPVQAEGCQDCSHDPQESQSGNETAEPANDPSDGSCQLVDYSLSKPTAVVVDPDRCFIPYVLGKIPI